MEITRVRTEGMICSLCFLPLRLEEEVFKFFDSQVPKNGELRKGHISIGVGQIHFRHLICQYNTTPRKIPFEEYLKRVRLDIEAYRVKKHIERIKELKKKGVDIEWTGEYHSKSDKKNE
jgi:hypothetical protein